MSSDLDNQEPDKLLPSIVELCLEYPLYKSISLDEQHNEQLNEILYYQGQLDTYCLNCARESIFQAKNKQWYRKDSLINDNLSFSLLFNCNRNSAHHICFYFQIHDKKLTKVGQFPSIADLVKPNLKKYKKILPDQQFRELSKGTGLAAHGVGIGSFVYLRRVFEYLVEEAHKEAQTNKGWDEDLYIRSRVTDKIDLLKEKLPDILIENKALYGILSKGIHELTEEECLDIFPIMEMGIELILDDVAAQKERDSKTKKFSQHIHSLKQTLSNS